MTRIPFVIRTLAFVTDLGIAAPARRLAPTAEPCQLRWHTSHLARLTLHLARLTPHLARLTPHLARLTPHLARLTLPFGAHIPTPLFLVAARRANRLESLFSTLTARDPRDLRAWLILSAVLLQEGKDWEAAERVLRRVLELDPNQGEARRNLEILLRQLGKAP